MTTTKEGPVAQALAKLKAFLIEPENEVKANGAKPEVALAAPEVAAVAPEAAVVAPEIAAVAPEASVSAPEVAAVAPEVAVVVPEVAAAPKMVSISQADFTILSNAAKAWDKNEGRFNTLVAWEASMKEIGGGVRDDAATNSNKGKVSKIQAAAEAAYAKSLARNGRKK